MEILKSKRALAKLWLEKLKKSFTSRNNSRGPSARKAQAAASARGGGAVELIPIEADTAISVGNGKVWLLCFVYCVKACLVMYVMDCLCVVCKMNLTDMKRMVVEGEALYQDHSNSNKDLSKAQNVVDAAEEVSLSSVARIVPF